MNSRSATISFCVLLAILLLVNIWASVPFVAFVGITLAYLLIVVRGTLVISAQFFVPTRFKASSPGNAVAITFDDGPVPEHTETILRILKSHHACATFFCIGKNARENPEVLKQINNEGHLIGNHSYFHGPLFDLQTTRSMITELTDTNSEIQRLIGRQPRFFRPPYGVTNPMLSKAVRFLKYLVVGWSVRSFDTVISDKDVLLKRVTNNLKGGDILLLHDRCAVTAEVLPELLTFIKNAGFRIESLETLLGERAYD